MSIVYDIPDVYEPLAVERLDRADLIGYIRHLEQLRSAWELRVRQCEEREQLWKMFLSDMGSILAATFQSGIDSIQEQADRAAHLMDQMKHAAKKVEDL